MYILFKKVFMKLGELPVESYYQEMWEMKNADNTEKVIIKKKSVNDVIF